MASIFQLFGEVFVNNDKADKAIDGTAKKGKSLGEKLGGAGKVAGKMATAVVTGATLAATGMVALATKTATTADEIDKASQRAGMGAEEYQKWAYAASMSGIEATKIEKAMSRQQKTFADAATGSTAAAEAYKQLGIDISSISSSEEAFNQVMANLGDMTDETERTAIANTIFGKSYADLAPLMNEGSEGMNSLKQELVDLGGVLSNDAVKAGAEFGDNIERLKTGLGGAVMQIGASVIPIADQFINLLLDNLPLITDIFSKVGPIVADALGKFLPLLGEIINTLMPVLIEILPIIIDTLMELASAVLTPLIEIFKSLMPVFKEIINAILPPFMTLLKAIMPLVKALVEKILPPLIELFTTLLKPLIELVKSILQPLIDLFVMLIEPVMELLDNILGPLIEIFKLLANILGSTVGVAVKSITDAFAGLKKIFGGIIDFVTGVFTGDWKKAWEGVKSIFTGIMEAIGAVFKFPINLIIKGINFFIRGLNKIKIPKWVPGVGGKGIDISEIPLLAKGASKVRGSYIAGEAGPELITPKAGSSQVIPLTDKKKKDYAGDNKEEFNYNKLADILSHTMIAALEKSGLTVKLDKRELGRMVVMRT